MTKTEDQIKGRSRSRSRPKTSVETRARPTTQRSSPTKRTAALLGLVLAACSHDTAATDRDDGPGEGWTDTWETGRTAGSTSAGESSGDDAETGGDEPVEPSCEELLVGASQMRRLTAVEYRRTVADLLRTSVELTAALPADNGALGFDNQSEVQEVVASDILAWEAAATEVSVIATEDLDQLVGCDLDGADESGCYDAFVRDFGRRAFRRPLTEAEVGRYTTFYTEQRQATTTDSSRAVQLVVRGLLMSPHFLYLVEPGSEGGTPEPLGPYAVASRLSYLLWRTMPDEALLAAAESGELDRVEGIEVQARRMLADPRASEAVTDFYVQWAGARDLSGVDVPDGFEPSLTEAAQREVALFIEDWLQNGGRAADLLTSTRAFVTPDLAAYYGVEAGAGPGPVATVLDPTRHAGLLTRMAFTGTHIIPPSRGDFVLAKVLCMPLPVPPIEIPEPPGENEYDTQRERFEAHAALECATACHSIMDPIGFAFEHYDHSGRWRDLDNGHPVDAATELTIPGQPDLAGPVDGAIELSARLAQSEGFLACQAEQWFTYAYNRPPTPADDCALETIRDAWIESDGDPQKLLVQLSISDALRFVTKREANQ
jgi:hypothetical protein